MRLTFITTTITLLLSIGLCFLSLFIIHGAVDEMTTRCEKAEAAFEAGDIETAAEILKDAGEYWEKTRRVAEMMVSHTLLMKVSEAEEEARASLTSDAIYEFERAMAVLYNALTDVHERESPSITNIL